MRKLNWIWVGVFGMGALMVILMAAGFLGGSLNGSVNSNGEQIYFTAKNDSGERITYTGGPGPGGMMTMRGDLACASCHGADGEGGLGFMHMQTIDAPDLRWAAVVSLDTLRAAVVEGKRTNGDLLGEDMPRWNLGDEDLSDLADYIKSIFDPEKGDNIMFGNYMMGGWWIIFPIFGFIIMIFFMYMMMRRGGFMSDGRGPGKGHGEGHHSETALDILKKRYANGEITKEEFDEIRKSL